jgi:AbrB family looped-hinge helix DNA binding protein
VRQGVLALRESPPYLAKGKEQQEDVVSVKQAEHDFGEATVTSKGQITVPNDLRKALDISAGDRLRFVQAPDGSIRLEARKRRRIVDFARANAFRAGEAGLDLDKTIDEAITIAMEERERRSRGG